MLYQLSYHRRASDSKPAPAPALRFAAMSARTFAVTMGVLAILGLLVYGVVSKGHGSLQQGDAAPVADLPALGDTSQDRLHRRLQGQVGADQRLGLVV